ncbi:MAG: hypothetical protein IKZ25_05035 [Clostridia bacterium]|nr:hypothetical protein [Clostridia bacterium]
MKKIDEIDKNLKIETQINKKNIKFYDFAKEPFKIYGVFKEDGAYTRLPAQVAKSVSEKVYNLRNFATGGRVRFRTNSRYVAIKIFFGFVARLPLFPLSGTAGLDMFVSDDKGKNRYIGAFIPALNLDKDFESVIDIKPDVMGSSERKMRDITIHLPLCSCVKDLYIGLEDDAELLEPTPYRFEEPIIYYGNSITQGSCVSRPGNSFPAIVSQKLDCDFINFGFSGSGMGEKEIAEYIASLPMKFFVSDYDHNAPSAEHLENTHERFFKIIREKNPDLPVVFLTSTCVCRYEEDNQRRVNVIYKTYKNALDNGDKNVYFIDGREIFGEFRESATVEGLHSNDLGAALIAREIVKVLQKLI